MHYFRVLVRQYKQQLGRNIHVFKPATTAEHWFGFDQAYFTADTPKPDVIQDLRDFIHNNASPRFISFRAFLLQFKVVEVARKRSALVVSTALTSRAAQYSWLQTFFGWPVCQ